MALYINTNYGFGYRYSVSSTTGTGRSPARGSIPFTLRTRFRVRRRSTPIQTRAAPSAAITAKICADIYEILLALQGNISLSWGRQIGSQYELSGCVNSLLRSQERDGASKYLFFSRVLMQVPISFRGNLPYKQHLEPKKNPIWFLAKSQNMRLPSSPRGPGLHGHGPWRVSDKANNLCRFVWKNQSKPNHLSLSLSN